MEAGITQQIQHKMALSNQFPIHFGSGLKFWPLGGQQKLSNDTVTLMLLKICPCRDEMPICCTSTGVRMALKQNCVLQVPTVNLKHLFCFLLCAENSEHCQLSAGTTFWSVCAVHQEMKSLLLTSVPPVVSYLGARSRIQVVTELFVSCACCLNAVMSCYSHCRGNTTTDKVLL